MDCVFFADIHLGRKQVFMNWYDRILFPTNKGVSGFSIEKRFMNVIEKINKDNSLDLVGVLGDLGEGNTERALELLEYIKTDKIILSGNHDDYDITCNCFEIHDKISFLVLETKIHDKTKGYFSEIPKHSQHFLKESIQKLSDMGIKLTIVLTHSPIFSRIIGCNAKKIVRGVQKDMKVVNIAGHLHKFKRMSWNNGMIEQIVLGALFCNPDIYKAIIKDDYSIDITLFR